MGWFSDLTGLDSSSVMKAAMFGADPTAVSTLAASGRAVNNALKPPTDPTQMSLNKGVQQGVGALSNIAFDDQGNLITQKYMAPGETTQGAMDALIARSKNDPLQQGAEQYFGNILSGNQTNPYLSQMYDQAAGKVRSSLDSQFERAGRYGGSEHEQAVGGALGDLATNLYGGQYNADQARMMQVAQIAPGIGYQGLTRQYGYGQLQDQQAQEAQNWDYNSGMEAVNQYLSSLGVAKSGYTPPQQRNKTAEALSILTAVGSLAGGNPLPALGAASGQSAQPQFDYTPPQYRTSMGGY